MSYNLIKFVQEEIDSGIGEIGRLQFILDFLKEDRVLYQSDRKYLETRISRRANKTLILENETNMSKNNKNQNFKMSTIQNYNAKLGQNRQTALFLSKSEMIVQPDTQKTLLEVKQKLENVLEHIERLERKLQEQSKFELTESENEQNRLSNELHDFIVNQKPSNVKTELFVKNKNKQKMDKNLLVAGKVLLAMTIVTIIPTIVILWFFGMLAGKLTWQNNEITYSNVSSILRLLLFELVLVLAAWPIFGIFTIIDKKRKKINNII